MGTTYEDETYQPFVKIAKEGSEEFMELPCETDGTILLSTVLAQFSTAIGLKYKSPSGAWRGIRAAEDILEPPVTGWGDDVYYITQAEVLTAAISGEDSVVKPSKSTRSKLLEELIVFGLPYSTTNEELEEFFTRTCGELAYHKVKFDHRTNKSKGFGFIRFKTEEAAKAALYGKHEISGRKLDVNLPKKEVKKMKLFVGRVPSGTTQEELQEYFSQFGELDEVFVPSNPFRGFGFVTFASQDEGKIALKQTHTYKGGQLRVTKAEPKDEKPLRAPPQSYNNGPPQSYNNGPPQSYYSGPPPGEGGRGRGGRGRGRGGMSYSDYYGGGGYEQWGADPYPSYGGSYGGGYGNYPPYAGGRGYALAARGRGGRGGRYAPY